MRQFVAERAYSIDISIVSLIAACIASVFHLIDGTPRGAFLWPNQFHTVLRVSILALSSIDKEDHIDDVVSIVVELSPVADLLLSEFDGFGIEGLDVDILSCTTVLSVVSI